MLRNLIERDLINISPCGVVFVKPKIREGILPRMLKEILDTRQMVKQSMKLHKSNSALQRILHSRQLGLKLMANVTYGYTAANFSGRMPAVEVGDSVVAKGRETLERAIKLVEANEKWNVRVVYGDTDSMFVLVPGRNREEAFHIGEEIAEAVTKQNPQPVKLKLEKVYQPCILQVHIRYDLLATHGLVSLNILILFFRPKNAMLAICTKHRTKRNQYMKQRALKLSEEMAVRWLQR